MILDWVMFFIWYLFRDKEEVLGLEVDRWGCKVWVGCDMLLFYICLKFVEFILSWLFIEVFSDRI